MSDARILDKLGRKLKKMRLRPIHVFLFHQVSDVFDESTMKRGDWTETGQFKRNIGILKDKYRFVSLEKACEMMRKDVFRFRRYAVLTSDDGWASLKGILPWLKEQGIPVTLFLNPRYFDGRHFREKETEKYLLQEDVDGLAAWYPDVTVASHGWEHVRATDLTEEAFRDSVRASTKALKPCPNYIPFFAYTYGSRTSETDRVLRDSGLVPVLIDKETNRDDVTLIHRELLDGKIL